jgi:hypothetical protein
MAAYTTHRQRIILFSVVQSRRALKIRTRYFSPEDRVVYVRLAAPSSGGRRGRVFILHGIYPGWHLSGMAFIRDGIYPRCIYPGSYVSGHSLSLGERGGSSNVNRQFTTPPSHAAVASWAIWRSNGRPVPLSSDHPPFREQRRAFQSSGSVVNWSGWPLLRAVSVARAALVSATSLAKTATTHRPRLCAVIITR